MTDKVMLMRHGLTAYFRNGKQVDELQESWFKLYLEFLESKGVDPTQVEIELPSGQRAKPFRTEYGWNWELC